MPKCPVCKKSVQNVRKHMRERAKDGDKPHAAALSATPPGKPGRPKKAEPAPPAPALEKPAAPQSGAVGEDAFEGMEVQNVPLERAPPSNLVTQPPPEAAQKPNAAPAPGPMAQPSIALPVNFPVGPIVDTIVAISNNRFRAGGIMEIDDEERKLMKDALQPVADKWAPVVLGKYVLEITAAGVLIGVYGPRMLQAWEKKKLRERGAKREAPREDIETDDGDKEPESETSGPSPPAPPSEPPATRYQIAKPKSEDELRDEVERTLAGMNI